MSAALVKRINAFLREADMPPSVFGRMVVRDPRLVDDLRRGREAGRSVTLRCDDFMRNWRAAYKAGQVHKIGDRRRTVSLEERALRNANGDPRQALELLRRAIEAVQPRAAA
ncbi:hypothetical protein GCM10009115_09200 [Sphingopyxis soli]|uniref:Uncharacterized protein n=1 Tax=Sphingopyxis soli TaxID=592051 RepID=A0ABN1LZM9_9SPHN|nr:hypothetical protein [Sphingopyxis soli]